MSWADADSRRKVQRGWVKNELGQVGLVWKVYNGIIGEELGDLVQQFWSESSSSVCCRPTTCEEVNHVFYGGRLVGE